MPAGRHVGSMSSVAWHTASSSTGGGSPWKCRLGLGAGTCEARVTEQEPLSQLRPLPPLSPPQRCLNTRVKANFSLWVSPDFRPPSATLAK